MFDSNIFNLGLPSEQLLCLSSASREHCLFYITLNHNSYTSIGFPATLGCFSRSVRSSLTSFILCLSLASTTKMIPCASPQCSFQVARHSGAPPVSSRVTRQFSTLSSLRTQPCVGPDSRAWATGADAVRHRCVICSKQQAHLKINSIYMITIELPLNIPLIEDVFPALSGPTTRTVTFLHGSTK